MSLDWFTDEELAYMQTAVRRMAPLVHRPEATLQQGILDKLRQEEINRFRRTLQNQNLR